MLLEKVLLADLEDPEFDKRRQPGRGNPTASNCGTCAAQLEMLRHPGLSFPEKRPARAVWTFEDGDVHAKLLREKMEKAYPNRTGLAEELFYFQIPISPAEEARFVTKIAERTLWGTIVRGFVPPRIALGKDGKPGQLRLAPRDDWKERPHYDPNRPKPLGFVIDPGTNILWVPFYIDLAWQHDELKRLVLVEFKSMSRYAFRKAVMGNMDYRYRSQLAMIQAGTALDVVWFLKAKDTAHLLEIGFIGESDQVRVTLMRSTGQKDEYVVKDGLAVPVAGEGRSAIELREDDSWDVGQVWTPADLTLLDQIRKRVVKVLLFEPPVDPAERLKAWHREYGPNFKCLTCDGTGLQTRRKSGEGLLKKPKECEDCGGIVGTKGSKSEPGREGKPGTGIFDEARLPAYPCGYCPVVKTVDPDGKPAGCWPMATLTFKGDKPIWKVKRADVEAAGITWTPPEGVTLAEITTEEV